MKKGLIILGIIFCRPGFLQEPVDFNHKRIGKEIVKTFDIQYYEMNELNRSGTGDGQNSGKYFTIYQEASHIGYCYIGRVNSCRAGGCSAPGFEDSDLTFEYFDYLILFDNKNVIWSVKVFNYQATHGQEICGRGWLKQFKGFHGQKDLEVGKDIDAISGATISVYAITIDIERITSNLKNLL